MMERAVALNIIVKKIFGFCRDRCPHLSEKRVDVGIDPYYIVTI